mgnify:CR=1 FL=1
MFIVVNHAVNVLNHICLRLIPAYNIVLDPIQYNGNTTLIIGFGDVKVKIQLPHIVNATDTNSNQNAVLSDL